VLAEVRELWRPLRSQWLAERVVLSLEEPTLRGLALRRGAISVPVWESLLPAQVLADGLPLRVEELGDFLGDLLLSKGLMAQPVWLALPRPVAHWRVIEWPFDDWPDAPLEALRTVDPELGLPFALADAAIDLQPLSGVPRPGQPLRSLLIAAPRQLVEAWIAVFAIAGATLERLVPAQVCLRQALLPALEPQQDVLVLECNGARCAAGLWRQGMPLYERQLDCDDPQLPAHLAAVLDYYGSRDPGFRASHLWLAGSLRDPAALARALGLPLRQLEGPAELHGCMGPDLVPADLLQEPRQQQGLSDPATLARERRSLVLRGGSFGAALLATSVVLTALLVVWQQQLQGELARLALVQATVEASEARLSAARSRLRTLTTANRALLQGLVTTRSGSALLRDLQTRVPQGVQLTSLAVSPGQQNLRLLGTAADPQAFARINALQIALGRSPLLEAGSVRLLKALRGELRPSPPPAGQPAVPSAQVGFELTAALRPALPPAVELQLLSELGATGMARRLQLLRGEGLLP
jgi:type IV pilus assembly protein PilN